MITIPCIPACPLPLRSPKHHWCRGINALAEDSRRGLKPYLNEPLLMMYPNTLSVQSVKDFFILLLYLTQKKLLHLVSGYGNISGMDKTEKFLKLLKANHKRLEKSGISANIPVCMAV